MYPFMSVYDYTALFESPRSDPCSVFTLQLYMQALFHQINCLNPVFNGA